MIYIYLATSCFNMLILHILTDSLQARQENTGHQVMQLFNCIISVIKPLGTQGLFPLP